MVIAQPPAHTRQEPFDRKFGDFFFFPKDIAISSKVAQLPGNK